MRAEKFLQIRSHLVLNRKVATRLDSNPDPRERPSGSKRVTAWSTRAFTVCSARTTTAEIVQRSIHMFDCLGRHTGVNTYCTGIAVGPIGFAIGPDGLQKIVPLASVAK